MNFKKQFVFSLLLSLNFSMFSIVKTIETPAEFEQALKNKKPQVIKFFADWCGACKQFKPHYEKFASDYKNQDVDFYSIDADKKDAKGNEIFKKLMEDKNIKGIPTTIFTKNGQEMDRLRGCPSGQCDRLLDLYTSKLTGRQPEIQKETQNQEESSKTKQAKEKQVKKVAKLDTKKARKAPRAA